VANADDARKSDAHRFVKVFHSLLNKGIYFAPSAFEAGFISLAHSQADLERTIEAFQNAIRGS